MLDSRSKSHSPVSSLTEGTVLSLSNVILIQPRNTAFNWHNAIFKQSIY